MIIQCWDKDETSDDLIGEVCIPLAYVLDPNVEINGWVPLAQKKGNSSHVIVGQINVVITKETDPVAAVSEPECTNLDCETAPHLKFGDKGADCDICKVKKTPYCSSFCHFDMCKYNGFLTTIVDSIREGEFT